jgi:hypothetical protein
MMMVVLAMTTAMPTMSHAAMKLEHLEQVSAHGGDGDCDHHHDQKTSGVTPEKPCCEKGLCKCIGGSCHNGLAKMFGNTDASLPSLTSSQSQFSFAKEHIESALTERLQRPPKYFS